MGQVHTTHSLKEKKKLVNKRKNFKQQTKKAKCASIRQRKARKDVLMINLQ